MRRRPGLNLKTKQWNYLLKPSVIPAHCQPGPAVVRSSKGPKHLAAVSRDALAALLRPLLKRRLAGATPGPCGCHHHWQVPQRPLAVAVSSRTRTCASYAAKHTHQRCEQRCGQAEQHQVQRGWQQAAASACCRACTGAALGPMAMPVARASARPHSMDTFAATSACHATCHAACPHASLSCNGPGGAIGGSPGAATPSVHVPTRPINV